MANRLAKAWTALTRRTPSANVQGELSALRVQSAFNGRFFARPLTLNTTRVTYELARQLYANEVATYKLAPFGRPIIDSKTGYIGRPQWQHPDPDVQTALATLGDRWAASIHTIIRNTLRDGDCFARLDVASDPLRGPEEHVVLRLPPPEWVEPEPDPITGQLNACTIRHPVYAQPSDPNYPRQFLNRPNTPPSYVLVEHLTRDRRTVEIVEGAGKPSDEIRAKYDNLDEPNQWGFVPVVHFRNEPDDHSLFGFSELESVEPILQAYHEVMLHAVQGTRLFSWPKIKFIVDNPDQFLEDNAGPNWRTDPIDWQDKEVIILRAGSTEQNRNDADFLQANSGVADVTSLLELLYLSIIEASAVPEFVMGGAVASSKASTDSQREPFEKTIERKRLMLSHPFGDVGTMWALMARRTGELTNEDGAVLSESIIIGDDRDVEVTWPEMSPVDEQSVAQTIAQLTSAFVEGVQAGLLSAESASDYLRQYVETMETWKDPAGETDEQRRILEGLRFLDLATASTAPAAAAPPTPGTPSGQAQDETVPTIVPPTMPPTFDYTALLRRLNVPTNGNGSTPQR